MKASLRTIDTKAAQVRSLVWQGHDLVDWCRGGIRWDRDGNCHPSGIMTAYAFDAAVGSPSGDYYGIFMRTGTKGVLGRTSTKRHFREINRSYYFANVYEMPIAFAVLPDGRQVLIHCPEKYNRLEIEDIESGERLGYRPATSNEYPGPTQRPSQDTSFDLIADIDEELGQTATLDAALQRKPSDVFHSRLSVSPSGKWLVSNGWYWHPHETVEVFCIEDCVRDARRLDKRLFVHPGCPLAQSVGFIDDDRLLIGLGEGWFDKQGEEVRGQSSPQPQNTLAVWRIGEESYEQVVHLERQTGTLIPLSERLVLDLFEFPKVIELESGRIVDQWPQIPSGRQTSCIVREQHPPPMAYEPNHRSLAVYHDKQIHILQFENC